MNTGLGWTLGDYVIGQPIDAGKFGTVYAATHLPSGRDVALKLIPLQGLDGDEKVAAERHGAMLQTRFGQAHRGLVPEVFEHQQIVTFYAISMELVHGQQLTDLIAAGPIPPRRAAEIALAICNFLEKAHRFETDIEGVHYTLIVHADLKPDHILLLDAGEIRVLDFGIAKALAARTLVTTNKWGSVHYASPERLQSDGHVNEHVDFWSLGIMLFEMVAGFRPYRQYEHNVSRLDGAIRRQEAREALPLTSDPVLATIIHKLLAPQLERRYASAEAIASDLNAFLFGGPVLAATELGAASQETIRISPPTAPVRRGGLAQATEPLPPRPPRSPAATAALRASAVSKDASKWAHKLAGGPLVPAAAPRRRRSWRFRGLQFVAAAWVISIIGTQALGLMRAARFRAQVASVEAADIASIRDEYHQLGERASSRVNDALKSRMLALADRAIAGYRLGTAPVAQAQWEEARECLNLAAEIDPRDRTIAARRAYVRGQLLRIAAEDGRDIQNAVEAFRESARLDPSSPDPYLGLARIFAYSAPDADALSQAIHDAEARGFTSGKRERAQLGDAHKVRADHARAAATRLTGEERTAQLRSAADDYTKCIEYFEDLHFFDSEENLRACEQRLADITPEVIEAPRPEPAADFRFTIPFEL